MGGVSSGSSSGDYSGNQGGTYSSQNTGANAVNPTTLWSQVTGGAADLLNDGGLTPAQQQALGFMSGVAANQPMGYALQNLNSNIGNITSSPAPTISTPGDVVAPTAASMMSPYSALYSQNLIQPALNAFDYGTQQAQNNLTAQQAAGGAFANSRSGVAQGTLDAQAALGRGQLDAQLASQGLQGAIGVGQTDAANQLQASTTNAANQLTAAQANLGSQLQTTQNQLAGAGMQASNDINTNTMGMGNAQQLYNAGSGGLSNLLGIASSQVPAFNTTTTGTTSGLYNGTSSGYNSGDQSSEHLGK